MRRRRSCDCEEIRRTPEARFRAVSAGYKYNCNARSFQVLIRVLSVRSLNAKAWEDRPVVLRQLDQIGEKS